MSAVDRRSAWSKAVNDAAARYHITPIELSPPCLVEVRVGLLPGFIQQACDRGIIPVYVTTGGPHVLERDVVAFLRIAEPRKFGAGRDE